MKADLLNDEKYKYLFSVEEVNRLVLEGVPFRDAYKKVGMDIEKGTYSPSTQVNHTHEGSIGNLCNDEISRQFNEVLARFPFDRIGEAVSRLVSP